MFASLLVRGICWTPGERLFSFSASHNVPVFSPVSNSFYPMPNSFHARAHGNTPAIGGSELIQPQPCKSSPNPWRLFSLIYNVGLHCWRRTLGIGLQWPSGEVMIRWVPSSDPAQHIPSCRACPQIIIQGWRLVGKRVTLPAPYSSFCFCSFSKEQDVEADYLSIKCAFVVSLAKPSCQPGLSFSTCNLEQLHHYPSVQGPSPRFIISSSFGEEAAISTGPYWLGSTGI